jgi:proline dehydrogenase
MTHQPDAIREQDKQAVINNIASQLAEAELDGYMQAMADMEAVIKALRVRRQPVMVDTPTGADE